MQEGHSGLDFGKVFGSPKYPLNISHTSTDTNFRFPSWIHKFPWGQIMSELKNSEGPEEWWPLVITLPPPFWMRLCDIITSVPIEGNHFKFSGHFDGYDMMYLEIRRISLFQKLFFFSQYQFQKTQSEFKHPVVIWWIFIFLNILTSSFFHSKQLFLIAL